MVRRVAAALVLLLIALPVQAATFKATVDRTQLYMGEGILLTLSLVNSDTRLRAQGLDPNVDLSVLTRDFELGTPRASHRYNIHRNRGRSTSEIRVHLFPRHPGELHIPPFTVDDLSTAAITLRVLPAREDPSPPVFARHGSDKERLWTGERAIVYLDLYHRVTLKSARLGGPLDTEPKRLHLSELPVEERKTVIEGLEYQVTRTAWSLTPVIPGSLEIYFPDIWVETAEGERIRLPFADRRLEVMALPAEVAPGTLVGRPALEQNLPEEGLRVGSPFTWEIVLRAATDLQALPASLPLDAPPALKIYFEPPQRDWETLDGQSLAVARYRAYVMPLVPGRLALPELRLPYFDPATRRLAEVRLPPAEVAVAPGVRPPMSMADMPPAATPTTPQAPAGTVEKTPVFPRTDPLARTAAILFAALWLITLILWWRHARHYTGPAPARSRPAPGEATRVAPGACALHERPPLVRSLAEALGNPSLEAGLHQWEQAHGQDTELRRLVQAVLRHHYASAGTRETDPELEQAVRRFLQRARTHPAHASAAAQDPWRPESFATRLPSRKKARTS